MELARRTWAEVAESAPTVALIPVGSVEQHGPHAPLGTDLIIAEEVANRGITATEVEVDACPAVTVGISAEHRNFAGSLWVTPDVFRAYLGEVARSLSYHGIGGIVFVNGHGGNVDALEEVATTVTREKLSHAVPFTWFNELQDPPFPMGHGGPLETSAILAIDEERIREDRLELAASQASERWGEWVGRTNLAVDVDEFAPNGVVGDPRLATKEIGERLLTEASEALGEVVDAVAERVD